jgi:hypothetical protein
VRKAGRKAAGTPAGTTGRARRGRDESGEVVRADHDEGDPDVEREDLADLRGKLERGGAGHDVHPQVVPACGCQKLCAPQAIC